jgi:hypothetical protein
MMSLSWVQWPAMVVTIAASYWVASGNERWRRVGFWVFLISNALWIAWGISEHAYALVILQVALAVMNIRGVDRNA